MPLNKFDIYKGVRSLRQAAGDIAFKEVQQVTKDAGAWREIETALTRVESMLERLELKED